LQVRRLTVRAQNMTRTVGGGTFLLLLGAALLALAVGLLAVRPGSGHAPLVAQRDPAAVTNGLIAFWEGRLAGDPLDFTAANRLGAAYLQRARESGDVADYSRAEAAVQASLASLPADNPTAFALLAAVRAAQHDFAAAEAAALQAIALDPSDPYAYGVLGDAQVALGRYAEGEQTYAELVRVSPGLTSFSREAHLRELYGDIDGARAAWENAFATDAGRRPENTAWARTQFGAFWFGQGDFAAARDQYQRALAVYPGFIHALAGLARVDAAEGDLRGSIELYERVVERQPAPEYLAAYGDVLAAAGREPEAQGQYDLVVAIDSLYKANGINTDVTMALFFADHGINIDDAVSQAQAAYDTAPGIYAADALAWTLHRSGRSEAAVPYIEEALSLGTRDAALHYHAGEIFSAAGDPGRARQHYEASAEINPAFSIRYAGHAQQALASLEAPE
jgi:tetratricopeptide (TPR) repeat protein